jgi:NADH-quinone oxidoreductase subunit E
VTFTPENRTKAEGLVRQYPVKRSALLPLLHLVQYQDGYISEDGVRECAELLDLTKAEVAAVSTFYTMYKREPMGTHLVSVCTNFSCAVRGGTEVYERVSEHLGVGHNQTTSDGTITLEHAECLGNCEGAPLVTVDYINYEMVGPDAAVELVENLQKGEVPAPTRGMVPPGIREASHRLAAIGPIDPDAPGQRLGLATQEHGAVPADDSGPGIATNIIAFGGSGNGQPTEVAPPDGGGGADQGHPASASEDDGPQDGSSHEAEVEQAAAESGIDAEQVAEEAAPSATDPAVQGAEGEPEEQS